MFNVNGLYTVVSSALTGIFNGFLGPNPAGGRANGTQITSAWLNDVQFELLNPLVVAGVAPAANTPTQVLQSLKRIFGGNRTLLSATTTLTADNAGLVVVNAAAGAVVLTLPLNSAAGGTPLKFLFMRTDTTTNTVTVQDAGSDTDAPGGATSLAVSAGTPLWIEGDGASVWDVIFSNSGFVSVSQFEQKARYLFSQSGSISIAASTTYTLATGSITFPSFSKTGAFRLRARMVTTGAVTGTSSTGNNGNDFQNTLNDGTNNFIGCVTFLGSTGLSGDNLWGCSDSLTTSATYAPGSTVTITQKVATGSGDTRYTITGSYVELYVEEA